MMRLSELVVLIRGSGKVVGSAAYRLHCSHLGISVPLNWIRRTWKRGQARESMIMLWLMFRPKGLNRQKIYFGR